MLLSTSGSVASHSACAPPPGSQPAAMTSPSQVHAPECHRPFVPDWPTPGSVIVNRGAGSVGVPPGVLFAPMSKTLIVSALADTALFTSRRITPTSWHPVRGAGFGAIAGPGPANG